MVWGHFTVIARGTRGKGVEREGCESESGNILALHVYSPNIHVRRHWEPRVHCGKVWSLKSGQGGTATDGNEGSDDGNGGNAGGDGGLDENHLGKWRIESWGCAVHLLLKHKVINMKKTVLNKILKIVIAVASAILGALGANAMNMR